MVEGAMFGKEGVMPAPRMYPDEPPEREEHLVREINERGAIRRVADQLHMNLETLRSWTRQAQADGWRAPGHHH